MNINATLFGQMITFAIFVWFTMKFVWPPITQALADREKKIADGLAAGERGERELELAQGKATDQIRESRAQGSEIVENANQKASQIIADAKGKARDEGAILLTRAKEEIEKEIGQVKAALRKQLASVAIIGAEKILARTIDEKAHADIFEKLIEEI